MDRSAAALRKLLAEIEDTLRPAPTQLRARVFTRITDLFMQHADAIDGEKSALFDEVFLRQTGGVDTDTLAATSARIAPLPNAPPRLVATLARHGVPEVAAPVLAQSPLLTTAELVAIAGISSPRHLLAIAQRAVIEAPLSQVLIELGDQAVINQLATNPGARFNVADFGALLGRASADDRARVVTRMPTAVLRFGGQVAGRCMMLDISPGGAKLSFDTPASVPELFTLEFTAVERKQIQCRVVWRRGNMLGLRFTTSVIALWDPEAAQAEAAPGTRVSA